MKNYENLNSKDLFVLADKFEVEELEERVEFGKWDFDNPTHPGPTNPNPPIEIEY
jgi:hypothetical protein